MNTHGIARFATKPEVKKVGAGVSVVNFVLVFEEKMKKDGELKKTAHFLDFEAWDSAADLIAKSFDKGQPIYVEDATPRQHTWQNEDGSKKSRIVFRLNKFQFVPSVPKKTEEVTGE